jgi:hypothetical protein
MLYTLYSIPKAALDFGGRFTMLEKRLTSVE